MVNGNKRLKKKDFKELKLSVNQEKIYFKRSIYGFDINIINTIFEKQSKLIQDKLITEYLKENDENN